MATYIRDNSLDNLQQSMSLLAQMGQRRKAQDLETAIALNRMGKNKEAESLLLSSQRGLLGNLFGDDAQEWTIEGVNAHLNPQAKELVKSPLLSAQQEIIKEMQGLYGNNTADYNRNVQGLAAQLTNRDIQDKGISRGNGRVSQGMWNEAAQTFGNNLKGIRGNEAAVDNYNKTQARNKQIEEYNKNLKPIYREKYTGNEVDQMQQLMDDTMKAVQNARSDTDKLRAYNKYITTGKAISDHYQHKFDAQPAGFFGISKKKGGSGGVKPSYYLYGDTEQVIDVPVWAVKNSKDREAYIAKNYPDIYQPGTRLKPAGKNSGETLNPLQEEHRRKAEIERKSAEDEQATAIYEKATGVWATNSDVDDANRKLAAMGSPIRYDYDGNQYRTDQQVRNVQPASNEQPAGDYRNLYLRK